MSSGSLTNWPDLFIYAIDLGLSIYHWPINEKQCFPRKSSHEDQRLCRRRHQMCTLTLAMYGCWCPARSSAHPQHSWAHLDLGRPVATRSHGHLRMPGPLVTRSRAASSSAGEDVTGHRCAECARRRRSPRAARRHPTLVCARGPTYSAPMPLGP